MKSSASVLGWFLLIAVLAVPSFLFYNWLNKSSQRNQAELANEPMSGSVFPSEKDSQPAGAGQLLAAPSRQALKEEEPKPAPAPRPAAGSGSAQNATGRYGPSSPPLSGAETGGPAGQPPPAQVNPPAAASRPAQETDISSAAQQGGGQSQVEVSTGPKRVSSYDPKTTRDPTFTPDDYRRIREEQLRREEMNRMRLEAERNKPREPGPEARISLQGIVGSAAIINGEMYSAGQTVRGVKILKIGADYIVAEYKGKKFRKVLK